MKTLTVIDDSSLSYAESFVKNTILDLKQIENTFFKIGFRLNEAVNNQYYLELGYNDIFELAEKEFGFKTTTTKNLMLVNRTYSTGYYSRPSMEIEDKYKKYSQTQLVEMLPLGLSERDKVEETWTARDIRDYKKITGYCFDRSKYGLPCYSSDINKDPKKYIDIYRKNLEEQAKKSSVSQLTEKKSTVNPDDIPAGQLYLDDNEELTEFHQNGAEQFSQSTDQDSQDVEIIEVSQSTDEHIECNAPTLHMFKNRKEREAFILNKENYKTKVLENEELHLKITRLDFANGSKIYRTEWESYSEYFKKIIPGTTYHLVVGGDKELPPNSTCTDYSCKCYTLHGTAMTYIVDYMTKYADEI